jgi:hypothetical protein
MSNPTTHYTVGGVDLSNIFQPLVQGTNIAYNTNYTVGGADLRNIFAAYTGAAGTQAPVTGYRVTGHGDLNTIFAKMPFYTITNNSADLKITSMQNNGYTGLIFETKQPPNTSEGVDTCTIVFHASKRVSCLIVGGGGGGGAGNYVPLYSTNFTCAGAGGGGGGFINDAFNVPTSTPLSIQVASAGLGRQATNPGQGNSTGAHGGTSSLTGGILNFTAHGGEGGKGIGTAEGYGGGAGGMATNSQNNTGGGGGGSGGGAWAIPSTITARSPGPVSYLNGSHNAGNVGTEGGTDSYYSLARGAGGSGGNGHNSTNVTLPFTPTPQAKAYFGNAGGGGGGTNDTSGGGRAGFTFGGAGTGSLSTNGESAINGFTLSGGFDMGDANYFYGNGGGGGVGGYFSIFETINNYGGNGSNGVVMLWWLS